MKKEKKRKMAIRWYGYGEERRKLGKEKKKKNDGKEKMKKKSFSWENKKNFCNRENFLFFFVSGEKISQF